MKKLLIGVIIVPVVLVGAVVAIPSLVPATAYKDKIESQLAIAMGRDVTISGDVKLSVFPVLKAQTGAIQIDNPDGFTANHFITMDGLDARIRLLPLLSKRVEVAKFELTKPVINLEKKANGSVNWTLGDDTVKTEAADTEPFKRDGRFNDFDPKVGEFAIVDGTISYRDNLADASHDITNASLSFSLPSLDEIVEIDGAMTLDGTPIDLDVSLDTPRYFLGGGVANFTANLKTEFASIEGRGQFVESEDIAFTANIDGDISDMAALTALIPQDIKYAELVNNSQFSGEFAYDGDSLTANESDISVEGDLFKAAYKGDAKITLTPGTETAPVFAGRVTADVNNVPALAKILEQSVDGIELIKTANIEADLSAKDDGFAARNLMAELSGDTLKASYVGQADIGESVTAQGDFTASIQQLPAAVRALKLELEQEVIVDSADLAGRLSYSEDAVDVQLTRGDVAGERLTASYLGGVNLRGENVTAKGRFTADAQQIPALLTALKIEVEQAGILDRAKVSGDIDYTKAAINLKLDDAQLNSADLVAAYTGTVNLAGEDIAASGVVSQLDIPSVPRLAQKAGVENKAAAMLGRLNLAAPLSVNYDGRSAQLNNLDVKLSGGPLNGGFTGNVIQVLGETPQTSLKGQFNGNGDSLRRVAQSFDVALPASKGAGAVFENFALNGTIDGDLNAMNVSLTQLTLDQLSGTGQFAARLSGAKPSVTGTLNIDKLDARPYQAAYASPASSAPKGWSKEPLNVSAIKNFDADIKLSTQQLLTSSVGFGQSDIQTTIKDSQLNVDFPNMALYGGQGRMVMSVDARRRDPVLDMDISLASLDTESVLSKFVSFANASGIGATNFKIRGAGLSMDSIMKSLSGGGEFGVRDGQVRGIDMASTLSGFTQGLSLQSAVSGLGSDKVTQFRDIVGKFSMNNGVMNIESFNFNALGVAAIGGGEVDIGNQNIDFRFTPRLTTADANGLAKAGIPLRISGDFNNVKTGLDQSAVSSLLAAQAQNLITDQVGGTAGAVLGSLLGNTQPAGGSTSSSQQSVSSPNIGNVLGSVLKDNQPANSSTSSSGNTPNVGSVLGSILGGDTTSQPNNSSNNSSQTPAQTEEVQPEDVARDLIGGLFGSKKKDKKKDDDE